MRARDPGGDAELGQVRDVPRAIRPCLRRRRALAFAADSDRRAVRMDRRLHLHPQSAVLRGHHAEPTLPTDILGARALAVLGDSVTTDHISPAGSIPADSPAGKYLVSKGVPPSDFNSYGARRGNHEVMMRGTFANIRLRNQLAPGTEGGWTTLLPEGEVMTIYDASVKYRDRGVPLMIIAGKEYGSGSSRDWAAKGTLLLGVKAVLAESFERIHRSNLVNMGVLPLQFRAGESASSLKLNGRESFDIVGVGASLTPRGEVTVRAASADDGTVREIVATARIDTPEELVAFRHGGDPPVRAASAAPAVARSHRPGGRSTCMIAASIPPRADVKREAGRRRLRPVRDRAGREPRRAPLPPRVARSRIRRRHALPAGVVRAPERRPARAAVGALRSSPRHALQHRPARIRTSPPAAIAPRSRAMPGATTITPSSRAGSTAWSSRFARRRARASRRAATSTPARCRSGSTRSTPASAGSARTPA